MVSVNGDAVAPKVSRASETLFRNEKSMISTLKKLQDRKAAQEIDGGFTLIELLIVIVVLGNLGRGRRILAR